jgi:hypothetical protein
MESINIQWLLRRVRNALVASSLIIKCEVPQTMCIAVLWRLGSFFFVFKEEIVIFGFGASQDVIAVANAGFRCSLESALVWVLPECEGNFLWKFYIINLGKLSNLESGYIFLYPVKKSFVNCGLGFPQAEGLPWTVAYILSWYSRSVFCVLCV